MADNIRTTSLRLRPSEHRTILFIGDLLMAVASVFAAIETWRRYLISAKVAELLNNDVAFARAQQMAEQLISFKVPVWFYLLPIVWMLLLVELYEPHVASSSRRTMRGIAIAAFVGLAGYSLVFIVRQDPNSLPRIGVGAFLFFASVLTLVWRMIFIRIYKSTGQRRRILLVGAGKAGQTLAELYNSLGTRSFYIVGYIDDAVEKVGKTFEGIQVLGPSTNLLHLIDVYHVSDLVIAINGEIQAPHFKQFWMLRSAVWM